MANGKLVLTHSNATSPKGNVMQVWRGNTFAIKDTFTAHKANGQAIFRNGTWITCLPREDVSAIYAAFKERVKDAPPTDRQIEVLEALVGDGYASADMVAEAKRDGSTYESVSKMIGDARRLQSLDNGFDDLDEAVAALDA
jgi:hypothetical protein